MLELDAFKKVIPELLAIAMKFSMTPNAYYEETEYRVFFHQETEAFVNLDMMVRFTAPGVTQTEPQKVCYCN